MKKTFALKNDRDGFTVFFGIICILAVSMAGVSLTYMSGRDDVAAIDHMKVRSAASTATAALRACESQFSDSATQTLNIINQFLTNSSYQWLFTSPATANVEKKNYLDAAGSPPYFSAQILSFDPAQDLILIKAKAVGLGGSKKNVIALYKIDGVQVPVTLPRRYSVYLGSDGKNFDTRVTINGDIYAGGSLNFNAAANGSIINGAVKTGASANVSTFSAGVTINGPVYFQTPVKSQGANSVVIGGKAGFEKDVWLDVNMTLKDSAFFNSTISTSNNYKMMNSNWVTHSGSVNSARINNTALLKNAGATINNLGPHLGLSCGNDNPFTFDLNAIPAGKIYGITNANLAIPNNFTGTNVNTAFTNATNKGMLWNGFLVIRIDQNYNMNPGGNVFTGNVIWIVSSQLTCNGNFYISGANSLTLVYVPNGGSINGFGSSGLFRGFIQVDAGGSVIYNGINLQGAINNQTNAGWQLNSGSAFTLTYDDAVMNAFINLGVVQPPASGGACGGGSSNLTLVDTKIRSTLLGVYY